MRTDNMCENSRVDQILCYLRARDLACVTNVMAIIEIVKDF